MVFEAYELRSSEFLLGGIAIARGAGDTVQPRDIVGAHARVMRTSCYTSIGCCAIGQKHGTAGGRGWSSCLDAYFSGWMGKRGSFGAR